MTAPSGLDPFSSMGGGVDDLFGWDMGVPTLGASQWGTQPLLTSGGKFDETKMDESATGAGTAMQPSTRGGQIVPSTGLGQLPVLRCRGQSRHKKKSNSSACHSPRISTSFCLFLSLTRVRLFSAVFFSPTRQ